MDGFEIFITGLLTILIVGTIGLVGYGLVAAFLAAPALTVVLTAAFLAAFRWVYPRAARFVEGSL